jgi:hypothetical protein
MSHLKPKLVLVQMWVIICLLLSISPASAQLRGDVNLNYIPYEVGDLALFDRFLLDGDSVLTIDPQLQSVSSDVNGDMICWTIGDLIHLERVIMEDADPIEGSTEASSAQVLFDIGHAQAMPYDTVSLPITYFTWGEWQSIHGLDWRIGYDPDKLTLLDMDLSGGRLEDWDEVHYRIKPGELRFSARPEFPTTSLSDSLPIAYPDTALLVTLNFVVITIDTPTYVPVYFMADTVPCYDLLPLSFACIDSSATRTGGRNSYTNGGVQVGSPPNRGDINLNSIACEVADLVLFARYFEFGDSVLVIDPEQQSANSDVNWDDFRWSMADFIHLARVILNDAPEVIEPTGLSGHDVETWMTTLHALPNDTVVLPVWHEVRGDGTVHGISVKVDYDPDDVTLIDVDFSETSLEDWELVQPRLEDGSIRINACPEFLTSSSSDTLLTHGVPEQVARLTFEIANVDTPTYLPVIFGNDSSSLVEANASAAIDGPLTKLGIPLTRNGGIQVGGSTECRRGDINFNGIPYEVADAVLFHAFLGGGPPILRFDPLLQACASNANTDSLYWTIADLLYLIRVILHDSPEIPLKGAQGGWQEQSSDELRLVSSSAHPGELVSVPVWLSNSTNAWGTTFKLVFDESALSVEQVEIAQTRIEEWEQVNPVVKSGELFFFAFDNWPLSGGGYPFIGPGDGVLARVEFRVDENVAPGTFLSITFETKEDWGHYNSYADTSGLMLLQPDTLSGWIFTDVISGDANSDGIVDVADLVYLINYLYRGGLPPSPVSLGDFNQDGEVNVADLVALINYLYRS